MLTCAVILCLASPKAHKIVVHLRYELKEEDLFGEQQRNKTSILSV